MGDWSLSQKLREQGGTPPWTGCPSIAGPLTPTLRVGQFRRSSPSKGHTSGMWEETGAPEKTHGDVGRTCRLHTDSGPGWGSILFFHQRYNKTMLFKNLLTCVSDELVGAKCEVVTSDP